MVYANGPKTTQEFKDNIRNMKPKVWKNHEKFDRKAIYQKGQGEI